MATNMWENFVDRHAGFFSKSYPSLWLSVAVEVKRVLIETYPVEISEEVLIHRVATRIKDYGRKPELLRAVFNGIPVAKWAFSVPWSITDYLLQKKSIEELKVIVDDNLYHYAKLLIEDYDEMVNILGDSVLTYEDTKLVYDCYYLDIF